MPEFDALQNAEAELADGVLPEDPDSLRQLTAQEQLLTKAYLILACGLVEEFFEECFSEFVAERLDSSDTSFDGCFITLAVKFADDLKGQLGKTPLPLTAAPTLKGLYNSKIVQPNNGMKRKNLEALAKPIGLNERLETECEGLLGPADTLGARRGSVAHAPTMAEEIQPSQARELVTSVLNEIPLLIALLT